MFYLYDMYAQWLLKQTTETNLIDFQTDDILYCLFQIHWPLNMLDSVKSCQNQNA